MATGTLRPNVPTATIEDYEYVAKILNQYESLYAVWNVGGVCVVMKRGDVYRCMATFHSMSELANVMPKLTCQADPVNRMIHIK